MNKRTYSKIEQDIKAIKEAAKTATTIKEIASMTALNYQKVMTSLSRHPIIKKRVLSMLQANKASRKKRLIEQAITCKSQKPCISPAIPSPPQDKDGKWVVICDCPALLYGFQSCFATRITIPQFVESSLIGLSKSGSEEGKKANNVLTHMGALNTWCTVAPKIQERLLVYPSYQISWRTRALVALACKYYLDGYKVTVKTRTKEIEDVATLQGCLTVDFVSADNIVNLKAIG